MLGPRRFDEIKLITEMVQARPEITVHSYSRRGYMPAALLVQRGEIGGKDLVARSRYVMGEEAEYLHHEYLTILRKLGHATK